MMALKRLAKTLLALTAGLFLWSGQATAQGDNVFAVNTTQDLVNVCTLPEDDAMRGEAINYCLGYIDGAVSYHDAISAHEDLQPFICYPETATVELGAVVFIECGKQQQGDAEMMETAPVIGVVRALAAEWPCT